MRKTIRQGIRRSEVLVACAAFGSVSVVRMPARAAQFNYKLGHPDPVDFPTHVSMVQMANAIKDETQGRMDIHVFPNALLGSPSAMLGQLRLGSLQFLWMNHSTYSSVVPVAQIAGMGFAFSTPQQPLEALDDGLGAYIRQEFAAKGIFVFEKTGLTGFRQMTSSVKPIRTADDMVGFKVRTLPSAIFVDLFRTLGASPVGLDSNEMYTAAQTRIVDGVELPLGGIETYRMFEVQKYISVTNHIWGGYWLAANGDTWSGLPSEIQNVVRRNAAKYALVERREDIVVEGSVADKLRRQGMVFNTADVTGMRARLGPYYAKWKGEFGSTAWRLLEAKAGKLG